MLDADTDALWTFARSLRAAEGACLASADTSFGAANLLTSGALGATPDRITAWRQQHHAELFTAAVFCGRVADQCEAYAYAVEMARTLIAEMNVTSGALAAVGVVGAIFTFGASLEETAAVEGVNAAAIAVVLAGLRAAVTRCVTALAQRGLSSIAVSMAENAAVGGVTGYADGWVRGSLLDSVAWNASGGTDAGGRAAQLSRTGAGHGFILGGALGIFARPITGLGRGLTSQLEAAASIRNRELLLGGSMRSQEGSFTPGALFDLPLPPPEVLLPRIGRRSGFTTELPRPESLVYAPSRWRTVFFAGTKRSLDGSQLPGWLSQEELFGQGLRIPLQPAFPTDPLLIKESGQWYLSQSVKFHNSYHSLESGIVKSRDHGYEIGTLSRPSAEAQLLARGEHTGSNVDLPVLVEAILPTGIDIRATAWKGEYFDDSEEALARYLANPSPGTERLPLPLARLSEYTEYGYNRGVRPELIRAMHFLDYRRDAAGHLINPPLPIGAGHPPGRVQPFFFPPDTLTPPTPPHLAEVTQGRVYSESVTNPGFNPLLVLTTGVGD
jgi:hypothetical protein